MPLRHFAPPGTSSTDSAEPRDISVGVVLTDLPTIGVSGVGVSGDGPSGSFASTVYGDPRCSRNVVVRSGDFSLSLVLLIDSGAGLATNGR